MNIPVPVRPAVADPSLEPYAQLLRALLPRMNTLSVFNALGELYWSTETSVEPALMALLPASIRNAESDPTGNGEQHMAGSEPTYLFWLRHDDGADTPTPFAVVAICFKPGNADADLRAFSFVHSLVRSGIECLRRELMARDKILNLNSSLLEQDNDLDMLLSITGGTDNKPESAGDFKVIVNRATEHLKVGLSALIVPEKGIALVQVSTESPIDISILAKAHGHLMSMAQIRRNATIVNRMVLTIGTVSSAYRVLVCPVLRADGNTMGVLALFRTESAPKFTPHYARLTELLASRVATIIGHSYDALTSLLTRPAFEQRVGSALQEVGGTQRCWSALAIDINRMHVINDNYGMHMGDRVIAQLGELIRTRLPPGAIAARISGDRFAILLPAALQDTAKFAEALRAGAEDLGAVFGDGKMQVSVSIGVSAVDARSKEFVHAFAAAETACKAANDRGRNRVELYQEADESIVRRFTDINLIADLRAAIAEDRLVLNAQLIVPLGKHQGPPHFEILLRMIGENGEIVGPDHFLSAAQRYQLMPTLDRWVIKHALEMLQPHAELLRASQIVFAINFSGQSLQDADFTEHVARMIESSGLDPAMLCFELTESAAIGNLNRAEVLMRRLRNLGCNIALDDFGTGLSSLAYLRTLPIGMLKIDGSFVRDVLKDPRAESMVQAIAQLARAMSLTTVAEYVETDEIRTRITALGVDYGQGFAIGRPVPLVDVVAELPVYAAAAHPSGVWPASVNAA
ncbi:MAG TPA: bifunctional diguanylate cyclase/phosphodiesterase [Steroidobacteraceae bacterium]|nr:bifunctional diguanylate cyclase/phosphodiesterase [Steroidobacteraceae bacterium]